MSRPANGNKRRICRVLALVCSILAAITATGFTALLLTNQREALSELPIFEQRIADLQAQVQTDSKMAPTLNEEQKRQADDTLEREAETAFLVQGLIISLIVFLASAKGYTSLGGWRPPARSKLVEMRFPTAARIVSIRLAHSTQATESVGSNGGEAPIGPIDFRLLDRIIEKEGRRLEAAIPILQAIQAHYRYLPDEALLHVCEQTEISPSQIFGASSFYANFRRDPVGKHLIRVCQGTACHVAGARQIEDELRRHLKITDDSDTDDERMFTVDQVACLGCCSLAPVMLVDDQTTGKLSPTQACQTVDAAVLERQR